MPTEGRKAVNGRDFVRNLFAVRKDVGIVDSIQAPLKQIGLGDADEYLIAASGHQSFIDPVRGDGPHPVEAKSSDWDDRKFAEQDQVRRRTERGQTRGSDRAEPAIESSGSGWDRSLWNIVSFRWSCSFAALREPVSLNRGHQSSARGKP